MSPLWWPALLMRPGAGASVATTTSRKIWSPQYSCKENQTPINQFLIWMGRWILSSFSHSTTLKRKPRMEKINIKTKQGTSETDWLVKCLSYKHQELSSVPKTHIKMLGIMVYTWNPSTAEHYGSVATLPSLTGKQTSERHKSTRRSMASWGRHPKLWSGLHKHKHTH